VIVLTGFEDKGIIKKGATLENVAPESPLYGGLIVIVMMVILPRLETITVMVITGRKRVYFISIRFPSLKCALACTDIQVRAFARYGANCFGKKVKDPKFKNPARRISENPTCCKRHLFRL
jgi:hypothetical protein